MENVIVKETLNLRRVRVILESIPVRANGDNRRIKAVLEQTAVELDGENFENEITDAISEERDYEIVSETIITHGNDAYLTESNYLERTQENIEWKEKNNEQY
jgi:hypothetical protein